jgi:hypothetical protein
MHLNPPSNNRVGHSFQGDLIRSYTGTYNNKQTDKRQGTIKQPQNLIPIKETTGWRN